MNVQFREQERPFPVSFGNSTRLAVEFSGGGGGGVPYHGEYEITPSSEEQILPTANTRLAHDIVINPIPSNYGLITWNGSVLTVS